MASEVVQLPSANAYLKRLGLSANPFPVAPDANRYFLTEALEALAYETLFCIQQRKGFIVITGEVGLGKTTFSRYLIAQLQRMNTAVAVIFNSVLQENELLEQICRDFGLDEKRPPGCPPRSLREQVNLLNDFFLQQRREGRNCVIFIDDAQNLSVASLESIRVLSNLETDTEKLVQVVLLGQQELREQLDSVSLRQLRSRVALFREIEPLQQDELRRYIEYKLSVTSKGAVMSLTPAASAAIFDYSGGNLRRANMLLDRVLIGMLRDPQRTVDLALVQEAECDLAEPRLTARRQPARHRHRRRQESAITPQRLRIGMGVLLVTGVSVLLGGLYERGDLQGLLSGLPAWSSSPPAPVVAVPAPQSGPVLRESNTVAVAESLQAATAAIAAPAEPVVTVNPTRLEALATTTAGGLDEAALREYLAFYSLEAELPRFVEVIRGGDMATLQDEVLRPEGLRLLRDTGFSPLGGLSQPVLNLQAGDGRVERWVLWRPGFEVGNLSYGLQSQEVTALQQRLAAAGRYAGAIDGIAGNMTFSALFEFQRRRGIPVTGQVDDVTLLWLHEYEVQP